MADLEKPEFTKEQLEAIKIVDKLYALEFDVNKAFEYYAQNRKEMICIAVNTEIHGFQHPLSKIFCDLIGMIKNKKLVSSELLEKYMKHVSSIEGTVFTSTLNSQFSGAKFTENEVQILKDIETKYDL